MDKFIKVFSKLAEFFQEKNGQFSSMRIIVFVGIFWVMNFTANWSILHPEASAADIVALFSGLAGTFIVLKLGQKTMEKDKKE